VFNVAFRHLDGQRELFGLPCVYLVMGAAAPEREIRFGALRRAYEDAFRGFSLQVHLLQSLMSQPPTDGGTFEEAKRRVEQAHFAYRESRDLLAQFVQPHGEAGAAASSRYAQSGDRELDQKSRVERLAYQLWEEAGRPAGRAVEHWYLAERLIQNAA